MQWEIKRGIRHFGTSKCAPSHGHAIVNHPENQTLTWIVPLNLGIAARHKYKCVVQEYVLGLQVASKVVDGKKRIGKSPGAQITKLIKSL